MNSKKHTTKPPSTVDMTTAAPRVESTGASMFAGASSPSVLGGEVSNSQRDQNRTTIIINVDMGGSDSDTSHATSTVSKTRTSGLIRDSPDASASPASDQEQGSVLKESSVSTDSGLGSSETSFEIESPPTEEENALEEEPPNAIYERHMCLKKHGFPLWTPQPEAELPHSNRGVSIGDVGIFTSDGGFDFLFNVCLPAGHPSNPDDLPEGFSHIDLKPADVCKTRAHFPHSYMCSSSVQKQGKAMTFKCSGSDGAILAMPQGAYHEDLKNIRRFRDYAAIHTESWYQYANGPLGREIGNGELHLVTGCDKTTSWGVATYSHHQSKRVEDNVTRLSFIVDNEGRHLYPTFAWDRDGDAEVKAYPEQEELMDPPEVHPLPPLRNQCTFVRSFTLGFGEDDWERLQSKVAVSAEAGASLPGSSKNPSVLITGPKSSPPGHIGSLRGHSRVGTSRSTDSLMPTQTLPGHPATVVIDMLLQMCPKAKVVVVHDSDWCSVIRDSDNDWMSIYQDLQFRIQEAFDIVEEENGTVYLQEKKGSSQQPSTSSNVSVKLEDEDFFLLEPPRITRNGTPYRSKSPVQVMSQRTRKRRKLSSFDYIHLPHPNHPADNPGPALPLDEVETSSLWAGSDSNDEAPSLNRFLNPFAHNTHGLEDDSYSNSKGNADVARGRSIDTHPHAAQSVPPDSLVPRFGVGAPKNDCPYAVETLQDVIFTSKYPLSMMAPYSTAVHAANRFDFTLPPAENLNPVDCQGGRDTPVTSWTRIQGVISSAFPDSPLSWTRQAGNSANNEALSEAYQVETHCDDRAGTMHKHQHGDVHHSRDVAAGPSHQGSQEATKVRRGRNQPKFLCVVCQADFTTRHNLKYHLKSHYRIKDNLCDGCGKGFGTRYSLKRHRGKCKALAAA